MYLIILLPYLLDAISPIIFYVSFLSCTCVIASQNVYSDRMVVFKPQTIMFENGIPRYCFESINANARIKEKFAQECLAEQHWGDKVW